MPERKAGKFIRHTFQITQAQSDFTETEAQALGISPAEYLRRVLDEHRYNVAREGRYCANLLQSELSHHPVDNAGKIPQKNKRKK